MRTRVVEAGRAFDPRTKLVVVLCISSLAVVLQEIVPLAAVLTLALAGSAFFDGEAGRAVRRLRAFLWIFVAMAFVQSIFTAGGEVLVSVGGVSLLTTVGLERAGAIILRFMIIVISASIMLTCSARDLVQGLHQWGVPYELAFMVALAIRFLPLLREEAGDALIAIQLRGLQLDAIPLRQRLQVYSYLLTPMIASVLGKARELAVAVEMRGFRAYDRRTCYRTLQMKGRDWTVVAGTVLLSVGLFAAFTYL